MKRRLSAWWARWKARHWDARFEFEDEPVPWLQYHEPPLRMLWRRYSRFIVHALRWLLPLVAGAVILKVLGLA